ncbi:MAG: AmmeMemoRadiSam system protein B [Gammaproteobacteria bacterium]|uniref:MEMO1 family protein H8D24_07195 n=1 Tax=Candidatus Thiopontia autotrophica TaxID=2841688 RepID=A0A8J6P5G5_9GAMM|nr:AmmeMemoRadiSam system protein B [Candidatus Thiopontia autotrophica]MBL6968607.1 AmmeMemoRadiSam system protein B [Gammaproteobacteria bacterium]
MIREPAVAGTFYPADPVELSHMVRGFIDAGQSSTTIPKAIIAPHAGYIYSGPVAGSAYRALSPLKGVVERVVLLGPSHHLAFNGLAASGADFYASPLGLVPLDRDALQQVIELPQVKMIDEAHQPEHSLEVHIPFLQEVLGDFSLLPLVVGNASPTDVAEVLEALWGGPETVIIISSDLSHYQPYEIAQQLDSKTSQAIEDLDDSAINHDDACGRMPINGLLYLARKRGLQGAAIDLRNSGDTAGDKSRVVGYGAYLFSAQST